MKRSLLFTSVCMLGLHVLTHAQNLPFPQNKVYGNGLMPTNRNSADASSAYTTWKNNFVVSCGDGSYRVRFDNPAQTVSEGIGYGMLLSAYAGDKALFDGLWQFYKKFRNSNGVMHWKIDGCNTVLGQNGATDSEVDAAMALIVANSQWTGTYGADAKTLIGIIKNKEVEAGTLVLKPGDMFGGSNLTNPSYFATGYFRAFGQFTNDATFWNGVAAKAYQVIEANLSSHNAAGGLVSDWTRADGAYSSDAAGYVNGGTKYTYDAARTPWRVAVDYAWYGSDAAKSYLLKTSNFVRVTLGGSRNVKDGYNQNGTPSGQWHNSTFVGAFATAAMGGGNQAHLDDSYADLKGINDANSYFNQTLKTLYLFLLTGNFYLPGGTTTPTNTPPTVAFTSPANNATFTAPATIALAATASDADGTIGKVEFYNGSTKIGEDLTSPYTATISNLAQGTYTLTAKATDNGGASSSATVTFTVGTTTVTQTPYGGTPWAIPGRIEAERYDVGGSGVAYQDADATNSGAQFRTDGVDVEATSDAGGGYNVGWTTAREWLEYSVNVATAGKYDLKFRVASTAAGRTLHLEANGVNLTGAVSVPNTGGWQTWRTITVPGITLTQGAKVLRLVFDTDGINFNYFEATSSSVVDPTNSLPTVALTAPANNSTVKLGTTLTLAATATDQDGTISKVEFYRGSAKLGEDLSAPYAWPVTDAAVGTYAFSAKAFDNVGGSATSTAVSVTFTSGDDQTSSCVVQALPVATEYVLRNAWNDNNNGSAVTADPSALKISHRAWGMSSLWLIHAGKTVAVQAGKTYTLSFDIKNDPTNPIAGLSVGLASSVGNSGPTLAQTSIPVAAGFSSSSFSNKSITFTASTTGNVSLAFQFTWPGQPNALTSLYVKNISFCAAAAVASPVPPQDNLTIFPNPSDSPTQVYLKSMDDAPVSVVVSDVYGNTRATLEGRTNQAISFGNQYPAGQYFIKATSAGQVYTGVWIKN